MRCRIRIKGHLDHSWQEWLEGLELVHDVTGTTILCGTLRDQAVLYGVLLKIRRLNVRLLSHRSVTRRVSILLDSDTPPHRMRGVPGSSIRLACIHRLEYK